MMLTLVPMSSFAALADITIGDAVAAVPVANGGTGIPTLVAAEKLVRIDLTDLGLASDADLTDVTIQFDTEATVEAIVYDADGNLSTANADYTGAVIAGSRVTIAAPVGGQPYAIVPPATAPVQRIYAFVTVSENAGRKLVEVSKSGALASYVYVEVSGTSADATLLQSKKNVARGNNQAAASFMIKNPKGTSVTFKLPRGFEWNSANTDILLNGVAANDGVNVDVDFTDEKLTLTELTLGIDFDAVEITVIPSIDVTRDARLGDVTVSINSNNVNKDLVIATYKDFGLSVKVDKVAELIAGQRPEDSTSRVKLTVEGIAGSLISGRDIEFTFNNGKAIVRTVKNVDTTSYVGKIDGRNLATGNTVNDTYVNSVVLQTNDAAQKKFEITFDLQGDWNAGGKDLTVDIKGRDIDEKGLVLAKVEAPVTVTAEKTTDVKIGVQRQATSDIVVTETKAAALSKGEYVIDLSDDSSFYGLYFNEANLKVTASEGDLDFDYTVNRNGAIVINVKRESRTATKLVVSGVTVSLDRTLPEGPLSARFAAYDANVAMNTSRLDNGTVVEFPYLNITNAAPGTGTLRPTTVFTIGQSTFTVSGETRTLDAAPYISNNRTMLPIGAVAQVIGATVNYSPSTRTAVFTKDNLVVTMNLDTNILLANGSVVTMDAKPEIVNSRAFVPVVFVAQAFGVQNGTDIVYDAATQTITKFQY